MHHDSFFFQAFVYLSAAVISVPIAKRLGLGSVLGYLLAGIIIGPFALGLVGQEGSDVMHFAEFGVVMMLFLIGLELQPALLWRLRGPILGMGGLQVLITAILIMLVAFAFGVGFRGGLAIGLILALSSTAIVLQSLNEKGLIKTPGGQGAFSILLFQDIAVIPMLALLPLLAMSPSGMEIDGQAAAGTAQQEAAAHVEEAAHGHADGDHGSHGSADHSDGHGHGSSGGFSELPGWLQAISVLATVGGIILFGRFLVRPAFRFIAASGLREIFTAGALLMVIGIALAMTLVGLSPALGAFLAGVVLADNEFRHELESDIEPFKGLLLGLFFISVGASINFSLLAAQPLLILGLMVVLIVLKMAVLVGLTFIFKLPSPDKSLVTFSLAQGGEFGFVLFSFALQQNVLTNAEVAPLIAVIALTMAATPLLMIFNEKLVMPRFATRDEEREADEIDDEDTPVIIAGFGRFGHIVGRLLCANNVGMTVLDHDAEQIEALRKFGFKVFYGDACRLDLLRSAGCERAKVMVVAVDEVDKCMQIVETVQRHFPNLKIVARAIDRVHAYALHRHGVDVVCRDTFESSLETGVQTLQLLGFRAFHARRSALAFKQHDEEAIRQLSTVHEEEDERTYILRTRQLIEEFERTLENDRKTVYGGSGEDQAWDASTLAEDVRAAHAHLERGTSDD